MSNAAIIAIAIAVAVCSPPSCSSRRRGAATSAAPARCRARRAGVTKRHAVLASTPRARPPRQPADEPSRPGTAVAVLTAEEAERAGDEARRPTPVLAPPAAPVPWVPPDPEAIGVSRRQFFNRATVMLMGTSIGAFTAAGFVAFLWPTATGGFGQVVSVGKLDDIMDGARANSGFFYAPSARTLVHRVSRRCAARGRGGVRRADLRRDARLRPRRPLPEVPAPRLPRARLRVEPLVRVPVPRLAVQPGRREEGRARRRAGWIASASASTAPATSASTPAPSIAGPPIGTNTTGQEAEGPHCITGGGAVHDVTVFPGTRPVDRSPLARAPVR